MANMARYAGDSMSNLLPRDGCVTCTNPSPPCPTNCGTDQVCKITSLTCTACPQAYCAPSENTSSSSTSQSSGTNPGAIAGGVIGGVIVIAVVTYLVWRFCIRNRPDRYSTGQWDEQSEFNKERAAGAESDFASRRSQRASTHTVNSIASTVLTRASNIIQIAYIPGVTNRANPTSPTLLVPPVPPIPLALSEAGTPSSYEDQHFFVPGDLRDSTYSGISGYSDRTSYARTSYAPRSSIASTIYGKNAIVSPLPAQKGTLLKPSLVSVKSRSPSGEAIPPPVPTVDYGKYDQPLPSPAFSIGSTFLKNASASTATAVRPQVVRVGSGPKKVDMSPTVVDATDDEDDDKVGQMSPDSKGKSRESNTVRDSNAITIIDDTPVMEQGPFADPPSAGKHARKSSLSAVIEEATRRSLANAKTNTASAQAVNRENSPFSDANALKEE